MTTPETPLLRVADLTVRFGGLVAIQSLDLAVPEGRIFALVGPNGAGKTTLVNCISGFVRPTSGTITFAGTDLLATAPHRRAGLGIARTFQNVQLFSTMTVLQNLLAAQHAHLHTALLAAWLPVGPAAREDRQATERARETLALLGIERFANYPAGVLPFGIQKLVGVARALVLRPKLVLLDEPAAGMPHAEALALATHMHRWRDELGTTLVLIEHNMPLVQEAADLVCVLDYGRKLAEGTPRTVLADPAVLEAYLGRDAAREAGRESGRAAVAEGEGSQHADG